MLSDKIFCLKWLAPSSLGLIYTIIWMSKGTRLTKQTGVMQTKDLPSNLFCILLTLPFVQCRYQVVHIFTFFPSSPFSFFVLVLESWVLRWHSGDLLSFIWVCFYLIWKRNILKNQIETLTKWTTWVSCLPLKLQIQNIYLTIFKEKR